MRPICKRVSIFVKTIFNLFGFSNAESEGEESAERIKLCLDEMIANLQLIAYNTDCPANQTGL